MTASLELRGRHRECSVLRKALDEVRAGRSAALVVHGEQGVGKTALLNYAVDAAPDLRVLRAAGVESEMELAFAALHQMCGPVLDLLSRLPAPPRSQAAPGPCRMRRPACWPGPPLGHARCGAPDRGSVASRVPGTRRPRPGRRGLAPARPSAPVPRRSGRPAPARPGPDARPAGRDRPCNRSPPPVLRGSAGGRRTTPTGRPPNAPADAGTAPGRR
ncbi:MAG TPA: AAA family ATPase [Streptosporangiaceae bacterium]